MGDDQWGQKYKDHFKATGVNVDHVYITKNSTTGIAQISVADNGENQIVIVPGANSHLSVKDVENCVELIKNADVLIAQSETPMETTLKAFKYNKGVSNQQDWVLWGYVILMALYKTNEVILQ